MDISRMLSVARQSRFPKILPAKKITPDEKHKNLIVNINLSLSDLFKKIQLQSSREELLESYCYGIRDFLELSNFKEWSYLMLMDDNDLCQLAQKWKSDSLATVYLSIQQQIGKCYLNHQSQALIHAWHIYLKLGLVDLRFNEHEIEKCYFNVFE